MNRVICIICILCSLVLLSCRRSARNNVARYRSKSEVVDRRSRKEDDRNRQDDDESFARNDDSEDYDDGVSENDDDVNVTPRSTDPRYTIWSSNGADNVDMLKAACDYNTPKTKGFANKLAGKANYSDGTFNIEQLCEIFDYCYNKWRYVQDPKGCEYLAKASETITSSLTGDCDDFAVLIASCMLAVGGEVCIVVAHSDDSGHAYAEVDISHMDFSHVKDYVKRRFHLQEGTSLVVRRDGNKNWLNLDWSGNYPGGPTYKAYSRLVYKCIEGRWLFVE